jgi:hypothetical protein
VGVRLKIERFCLLFVLVVPCFGCKSFGPAMAAVATVATRVAVVAVADAALSASRSSGGGDRHVARADVPHAEGVECSVAGHAGDGRVIYNCEGALLVSEPVTGVWVRYHPESDLRLQ